MTATVRVDGLIADHQFYADMDFEYEITRADYEEAAMPVFNRL